MLNYLRKPLAPVIDLIALPFSWINPNVLSFMSFLVAAPGFYFLAKGNSLLGSLFVLGAMFDSIDGAVAKRAGKSTKFGGVLDATLDRIFDGLVLFFIGIGELASWPLVFLTFIAFVSVSYIKAKTEAVSGQSSVGTNEFSIGLAQRGERLTLLTFACVLNYFLTEKNNEILIYTIAVLLVLSAFTVLMRGFFAKRNIR